MSKKGKTKKDFVNAGRVMWERKPQTQIVKNKKAYDRNRDKKQAIRNSSLEK